MKNNESAGAVAELSGESDWWDEDAERLNALGELARSSGVVIELDHDSPELKDDGSLETSEHLRQVGKRLENYEIKSPGPHKFGCLMAMLPPAVAKQITDWTLENVQDYHLSPRGFGRETLPHVTIVVEGN